MPPNERSSSTSNNKQHWNTCLWLLQNFFCRAAASNGLNNGWKCTTEKLNSASKPGSADTSPVVLQLVESHPGRNFAAPRQLRPCRNTHLMCAVNKTSAKVVLVVTSSTFESYGCSHHSPALVPVWWSLAVLVVTDIIARRRHPKHAVILSSESVASCNAFRCRG